MKGRSCQVSRLPNFRPMEFSIKLHTIKSGWLIMYIEGLQVKSSQNIVFLSLKIDFVLANSADPDEMPHNMWHFIWVFTVCQSTPFGVSSP